jgi:hypothetical protein
MITAISVTRTLLLALPDMPPKGQTFMSKLYGSGVRNSKDS